MRLGCFGYLEQFDAIEAAGYDCAELDILEIMSLDNSAYEKVKKRITDSNVKAEVYNTMIPLESSIISPDFNWDYWIEFSRKGASRAAELGGKFYVFGNGKARRIPESGDIEAGRAKVLEFISKLCDITSEYGITMLLEVLSTKYSNFILSIKEAVDVINELRKDNLKVVIDLRHLVTTGEPFEEIVKYKDYIWHVHIDNPLPEERYFPRIGDGYDYKPFIETLKKINYNRILSVEARHYMVGEARKEFAAQAARALDFFKEMRVKVRLENEGD